MNRPVLVSRILACWALATLCWGAGCSTETRVIVHLDAEEAALTKVAYLRVEVSSIDLTPRRSQDLRVAGAGVEASFPVDVPLAPLGDDASRGWVVVAELCDAKKRPLSRQRAVGGYVADETREVWLVFEESCVGELGCSARQTCSQGQCVDACVSFEGGGPCAGAMLPSNVGDLVSLHGSSERLAVQGGETWVLDTTRGSIEAFTGEPTGQPARVIRAAGAGQSGVSFSEIKPAAAGGQPLGVFGLGTLTIAEGARVIGVGQRPLVILAADEVTIRGEISVAADAIAGAPAPGAGGFSGGATMNAPGRGPGAGQGGAKGSHWNEGGGGGASFGGRGGRGADGVEPGESDGAGGAAGATHGSAALIPLVGGSGGGAGGGASGSPRGGHGGGALQISAARRIELGPSGQIDACGGGGGGTRHDGGGGGGSGGAILLEAPAVSLSGIVGANGGAGNRGGDDSTDNGPAPGGEPGRASAPGPQGSGTSGSGGDGSDADGAAKEGGTGQNSGGGGGGGGRIRVNTAAGTEVYSGLLPRPESGLATVGRIRQSGTP